MTNLQVRQILAPQARVNFFTGLHPEYFVTSTDSGPEETESLTSAHELIFVDLTVAVIDSLPGTGYGLVKPIAVEISYDDGEYLAQFTEAEITTSGDSPEETIEWLRSTIVSLYELYDRERATLGPLPRRQLDVLEAYIGEE